MQTREIAQEHQEDVLASFWTMLKECEAKAMAEKSPLLMSWVEQWYAQWNRVTGDTKKPCWAATGSLQSCSTRTINVRG